MAPMKKGVPQDARFFQPGESLLRSSYARAIAAARRVAAAVLLQPRSQLALLLIAQLDAAVDRFHGLLLVALGTRERMLLEELLHLFGLLRIAETLRAVEKHSDAAQSAAGLLVDLVKVRPHEVPRSVLAGRIADQVNQNVQVLAADFRGQSRI